MKGLNPRHQNLLPISPESEYYHQNGNFDPQHSAKLIDVYPCLRFSFKSENKKFLALMTSHASSVGTTFRYQRVKSEASKFIAILF